MFVGGELQGDTAGRMDALGRRGGGSRRGSGERRRRGRSVVREGEARERRMGRVRGQGVLSGAEEGLRGASVTQASREEAWRLARALSHLCLLAEVRDDWHRARWAGPAQVRPR